MVTVARGEAPHVPPFALVIYALSTTYSPGVEQRA
jgi:hypothetical protein